MEIVVTSRGVELVKIADPKKPGDYLLLARAEFNPSVHRLFGSPAPASVSPEVPTSAPDVATPTTDTVSPDAVEGGEAGADVTPPAHDATDSSPESDDPAPADPLSSIVLKPRRKAKKE